MGKHSIGSSTKRIAHNFIKVDPIEKKNIESYIYNIWYNNVSKKAEENNNGYHVSENLKKIMMGSQTSQTY